MCCSLLSPVLLLDLLHISFSSKQCPVPARDYCICLRFFDPFREGRTIAVQRFHNPTPILMFQLEGDVAARLLARSGPGGSSHCHDPQQWDKADEILGLSTRDLHEKDPKSLIILARAFNLVELRRQKSLFYYQGRLLHNLNEHCLIMSPRNSIYSHWYFILMLCTHCLSLW